VQWTSETSFFVEATPVPEPEVILNVATPWSHGHSSLLSPAATCPTSVIRVRGDGEVERGVALPMSQREVPTLNARCFPIQPSDRSLPNKR